MGSFSIGPGKLPPFIKVMILVNLVVLMLEWSIEGLIPIFGLTPARFFVEFPNLIYQMVTYMFLHDSQGIGHIFFNMFSLWMFGTEIERTWGSKRFGRFYFMAGISGAILMLTFTSGQTYPTIGASGAIWAILIAYWIMFPNRLLYLYFMFPVKVKYAIPGWLLLSFLFSAGNVAHMAHIGGALFGFLYLKGNWRPGWFSGKYKNLRYQQKTAKLRKNARQAQDTMMKVDAILDKINEVGIDNISKAERKFLEEASIELSKKQGKQSD